MHITLSNKIGQTELRAAVVKTWRNNPGNFDKAVHAAVYYAKKDNEDIVVVPGNSYGKAVFHIVRISESIKKYTVKSKDNSVAVVKPNGEVFRATASDS